jgi:hypothetical protein
MLEFIGFDVASQVLGETIKSLAAMTWVLIPVAGIIWLIVAGISEEKTKRQRQELVHRERLVALDKGMTEALERTVSLESDSMRNDSPIGLLIGGIITLGVGVGLFIFLAIAIDGSDRKKAVAVGWIPLCVGLSLIAAWWVARRIGRDGSGGGDLQRRI